MPYQNLEVKALEKISNKYLLTILVCKRVKQLQRGAKPAIPDDITNPFDIALKELATGKVTPVETSTKPPAGIPEETKVQSDTVEQNAQPDSTEQDKPSDVTATA